MKANRWVALLLMACSVLHGAPPPSWAHWQGPALYYSDPLTGDITRETAEPPIKVTIQVPKDGFYPDVFEGQLSVVRQKRTHGGGPGKLASWAMDFVVHRDQKWVVEAEWRSEFPNLARMFPLRNGDFLGVAGRPILAWEDADGYTPFGLLEPTDGGKRLKAKAGIPAGFSKPVWKKKPLGDFGHGETNLRGMAGYFDRIVAHFRVDGRLVLLSHELGYLWVFDESDGRLLRTIKIFSSVDEAYLARPQGVTQVVVGAQPRQDGWILVATRTEDAVIRANLAYPDPALPEAARQGAAGWDFSRWWKGGKDHRVLRITQFPHITWWKVDPETGRVVAEDPPHGFPDQFKSAGHHAQFRWRFKPDRNLTIVGIGNGNGEDCNCPGTKASMY